MRFTPPPQLQVARDPDISLGTLKLWVYARQFPEATDYWDANWLLATAHCGGQGASVDVYGAFLHTSELKRWLNEVESLHRSLSGQAELATMEPELKVQLTAGERGHVCAKVEITPNHLSQEHRFHLELDQSYLPTLAWQLRQVLKAFPIVGTP